MKKYIVIACALFVSLAAFAQKATPTIKEPAKKTVSHDAWSSLLSRNVKDGIVNYAGFKAEKAALTAYTKSLSNVVPTNATPKNEAMAYWINAYNAFTVLLVVDNFGVKSIKDINKGEPWKLKTISLGGANYSLDQIENEILRPKYKDARIHFAINCAAKSCPPLRNAAFTADELNSQLDEQTKNFINNPTTNTINAKTTKLSKIFDWFKTDFGNIVTFINKYSTVKLTNATKISYNDYDWSLNGK